MVFPDTNRPIASAVSMLSAMFIIGLIDNYIAKFTGRISVWQFIMMRSVLMVPLLLALPLMGLGTLWPKRWGAVTARSVALTGAMVLYFGALGFMPLAEALAGLFTSPIFVVLINGLVMKQRIGPWRILAVVIGFVGVLLVLQPGVDGVSILSIMPVGAGLMYAVSSVATRSWCSGESTVAMLASNMMMLGIVGAVGLVILYIFPAGPEVDFLTRPFVWPVWDVAPWILLQAVGSLAGVFLVIRAYQLDVPTNVAVFEYSVMIFGPAFAWILFGQTLELMQILGIFMIAAAGATIAIRSA